MKNKILPSPALFASFIIALAFLALPAFAQSQQLQYTRAGSIACGNAVCEEVFFELNPGEEKSVTVGGAAHSFKLVGIEASPYPQKIMTPEGEKEETRYQCMPRLSVDGSTPTLIWEAQHQGAFNAFNFEVACGNTEAERRVSIYLKEDQVCSVPDCAFKAELNLEKKWNLVPIYFITGMQSTSQGEIETALNKGTCKPQDFLVVYGYNSLNKEYVKLFSRVNTLNDLSNSLNEFGRIGQSDKIMVGTPFNSVWIYALNQCKLVAELTKPYEDFLLILETYGEEKTETSYIATEPGTPTTPKSQSSPQIRTIPGIKFVSDWNFWVGSKDMDGKSFDEVKGNCVIEKAFSFDAGAQSWNKLETLLGPEKNFIFKVTDKCMFGLARETPPNTPA
ncbi:MAG: hypothetical protein V1834_01910 [Candidatus Micrarchaeota archaeon]